MEFGLQFLPDVSPQQKSGAQYFNEALYLVSLCDKLGYTNIRIVEHYFHQYGGYSPNPIVFLTAASQRTRKARLITGAVLPVFNNPLKLAGEIGMLDAISNGRVEVGFARGFLPHEFARFGIDMNESRSRLEEGMEQVRCLLEQENVTMEGQFHRFDNVTSLPRPTQTPRPPFWVVALATPASFVAAGHKGYGIMAVPLAVGKMAELLKLYRDAWKSAGHQGQGRVMLAFQMFCAPTSEEAIAIARQPLNEYLKSLLEAASDWLIDTHYPDYDRYNKIIAGLKQETFESQVEKGAAWIGTPEQLRKTIRGYYEQVGGFDFASMQVNFNTISVENAAASMRLFAKEVMPYFC
ncbi:LLM class flavin-dependent oxidoreductase [Moorena sp. SIO3B2]|uniref:LLM class flavin-dependent oxidoreductase n=1 Tax=Moorena sp. SIO3B2 TaxID=2607827 RepID=UPI0013CC00A9|nr:LLM class flavin-dependent oxidoreductase [Moorena sp. SIO3B2]NEP35242.1 LLM class flavin-dependent oxidoreductase [Moorena sp. SIO3B2]